MGEAFLCRSGLQRYAVGDIFITTREGDPSALLGYGSWEQITGRFLLGSGSPEQNTDKTFGLLTGGYNAPVHSTGGEDWHTQTAAELAVHSHSGVPDNEYITTSYKRGSDSDLTTGIKGGTAVRGESKPMNNMPPYFAVNMWLRVA